MTANLPTNRSFFDRLIDAVLSIGLYCLAVPLLLVLSIFFWRLDRRE